MKKTMRHLFAILMTLAIAITAIPMTEVKAAEENIVATSVTLPVETITLDNQNTEVRYDDEARLVLSGVTKSVDFIRARYFNADSPYDREIHFYESEVDGVYIGDLYARGDTHSGTYILYKLEIIYDDGTTVVIDDNLPNSSFVVENNITDHIAPVIQGAEFEHNGQTFTLGTDEVIEFTAESITDEGGTGIDFDKLGGDAYVTLCPVIGSGSRWAYFAQQTDGSYKAEISVSSLTNTEWYVYEVYARDLAYNRTSYKPLDDGQFWHFFVQDANGICESERNITVNFYDENDALVTSEKVTATTGEVELASLLDEIPTYTSELEFIGWKCDETGQMLEDDTVFISIDEENEYNFYPVTSKRYVEVDLKILDEDGDYDWIGDELYLIEDDTTYQELIAMLPKPESVNGASFVKWDLDGYELTDVVEGKKIYLRAVYDKQLIEVYYTFMDEKGQYAEEYTTLTFAVDEKVTYEKVVNALPKLNTYEGVNLVKWNVWGVTDLTEEVEYGEAELEAEYDKYPVFIERTYVDNTGAVKEEKITKLYPAGTTMESIYNEYAVTPSDASTSLTIEDWYVEEGNPEEISSCNNTLILTAQYEDKNIVEVTYAYFAPLDDHGVQKYETVNIVVSNEIASDETALVKYCKESVENKLDVTHYAALGFEGWDYKELENNDDDEYIDSVYVESVTNEELITVYAALDIIYLEDACIYVYVVEAGETIVLPWEHEGHYLKWGKYGVDGMVELDAYTYVVPKDAEKGDLFFLMAYKDKELPGEADDSAKIVDDNKVLPEGAALRAILLEEGNTYTATKTLVESKLKDIKNLAIYDITLVNSKGVLIEQLDKSIKVTLDIPFAVAAGNTINVFRVDGDKLVQCTASISENKLSFETDHFSTYVFVEQEKEEVVIPPADGTSVPKTGDSTNVLPYLTLLLLGAGVFMVGNKRRHFVR